MLPPQPAVKTHAELAGHAMWFSQHRVLIVQRLLECECGQHGTSGVIFMCNGRPK